MKFKFNRVLYKQIKKLDHKQMEEYIFGVYDKGFEAGKKAAGTSLHLSDLETAIRGIKGIGAKKSAEIMEAIKGLQKEGDKDVI